MGKDEEFWKELERWEVIILIETWIEEKGWERIKRKLPKGYTWKKQWATRENKKGRAKGGMLMGVKEWRIKKDRLEEKEKEVEGIIYSKVEIGKKEWKIIGVYVNKDINMKLKVLKEWWEKGREENVIIGGDFNARTGEKGGKIGEEEEEEEGRRSKDKVTNREGKKLIEGIEEMGLEILNGGIKGDEKGEYTYVGQRGETVIDYVIVERGIREEIERMEVQTRVESDHMPLVITIREERTKEAQRHNGKMKGNKGRIEWDEKTIDKFRKETEEIEIKKEEIGSRIREIRRKVNEIKERLRNEEGGRTRRRTGWWDKECREKKKELRKLLRRWKRERRGIEEYREKRREYKEICEKKKEEERDRIMKEAEEARTERKVWNFLKKRRRKGGGVEERISMEEWKQYFMKLLGGVEERIVDRSERGGEREGIREEGEITEEETEEAIRRLKIRTAAGEDEIENEVWKYGGRELRKEIWEICNTVWKGGGWPEEWKTGVVVPIKKKGDGRTVDCYRGVTLLNTGYRIYATILETRLEREMEEKRMVPEGQTGFRKGKGTMDNIYIMNYLINREIKKKGGKMIGCFVDIKAAFDSIDREKLWEVMRERGVSEGLKDRIKEIYRETIVKVKVGGEIGEKFWVGRGVRQGCPLSAKLFIIYLADLEEKMKKRGKGGIEIRGKKIYTLQYADDLVMMAKEEGGMELMIEEFRRYIKEKGLEVNKEKTKIVRFAKRKGKERTWKWGDGVVEEIEEIKYLGYVFKRDGGQEGQIGDRTRKAAGVMREVWGIGKKYFKDDFKRRVWLFDKLVWPVMGYGAEVWGWGERKKVERMQERYIRWVLGVDWVTPGYIIRDEVKRGKLRWRSGKRAWKFEERLREGRGSKWAIECLKEIEKNGRERKEISKWENERRKFIEERGKRKKLEGERKETREEEWKRIEEKEKELQEVENWKKIKESRYNKWYKMIRVREIPKYIVKKWNEKRRNRVARYRMGNEMREGRYWEREEERYCRICEKEIESWEHVIERCRRGEEEEEGIQDRVRRILEEDGKGEEWMEELDERRKRGWEIGMAEKEK